MKTLFISISAETKGKLRKARATPAKKRASSTTTKKPAAKKTTTAKTERWSENKADFQKYLKEKKNANRDMRSEFFNAVAANTTNKLIAEDIMKKEKLGFLTFAYRKLPKDVLATFINEMHNRMERDEDHFYDRSNLFNIVGIAMTNNEFSDSDQIDFLRGASQDDYLEEFLNDWGKLFKGPKAKAYIKEHY